MIRKITNFVALIMATMPITAQKVITTTDNVTGALFSIRLDNDKNNMEWVLNTDATQYEWINKSHGWGLGFFSIDGKKYKWDKPVEIKGDITKYRSGDIEITVKRKHHGNDLEEEYVFKNKGKKTLTLTDIGINTPFNDNYPDAATCMTGRCNAHIWAAGSASYVNAMRMNGEGPHLGLVLTEGKIKSYEVSERALEKSYSNFRGVLSLNPNDMTLKPGKSANLSWTLFEHDGWDDFKKKALSLGCVVAESDYYIYEKGETAKIRFLSSHKLKNPIATRGKAYLPVREELDQDNTYTYTVTLYDDKLGDNTVLFTYDKGKITKAEIEFKSNFDELINKRAYFILQNQQMLDTTDRRFGAYMVYDNETNEIYLNNTPNVNPPDRDEGRERIGMGIFIAKIYKEKEKTGNLSECERLENSLNQYTDFVHKLQDKNYNTYSNTEHTSQNRNYNYAWVARFYLEMFGVTGERQYLTDCYKTLRALFRNFGHNFYAIEMPVRAYSLLRENGFQHEADTLYKDFITMANTYTNNGRNYPKFEVNYEQSIVAPSIVYLLRIYKLTGDRKYIDAAKEQMPLLESFCGQQPSYHLNDIAIRHWDGYWFGKRATWGDTFPHYWSALTALAYSLWGDCTHDLNYKRKAENILRNNLCLFFENGRASCAYIYPYKVNGQKAAFYDPFANDQDWALNFYLDILGE